MAELTEVVVDRKVLEGFKRRALKVYPLELLEQVVGRAVEGQARVFAFQAIEHEATERDITLDDDVNPMTEGEDQKRFDILGTIHSHPMDTVEPSPLDWSSMNEDGEFVMGVCSIRKTARRRFVSFAFFNRKREQMQLTISEQAKAAGA
ncbi:MAG TPA: Mov34/MPN/PAD-1 family protein [Terriglobales bacterium]|nr:Mov34/MPN/PAD-1 family protein [Terriglobales bacterium]